MLNKVSIGEAAVHYGVSQTTIHTWIKENKIQSERVSGRRWVFLEDKTYQETYQPDDETYQDELNFKIENEYLKQKVIDKEKQVEEANNQINELLKQQNQAQQLSAMQQKTIDKLTEQNQLLLETTQQKKPSFWQRLIGQKI
jgi:excisionase family DNA binding protein